MVLLTYQKIDFYFNAEKQFIITLNFNYFSVLVILINLIKNISVKIKFDK